MHNKDKTSEEPSISFRLLQKRGFRQGIVNALKANVQVSLLQPLPSFSAVESSIFLPKFSKISKLKLCSFRRDSTVRRTSRFAEECE